VPLFRVDVSEGLGAGERKDKEDLGSHCVAGVSPVEASGVDKEASGAGGATTNSQFTIHNSQHHSPIAGHRSLIPGH